MLLLDVTFERRRDLALVYSDFQRLRGEGRPGQFSVAVKTLCLGDSQLVLLSSSVPSLWMYSYRLTSRTRILIQFFTIAGWCVMHSKSSRKQFTAGISTQQTHSVFVLIVWQDPHSSTMKIIKIIHAIECIKIEVFLNCFSLTYYRDYDVNS